MIDGVEVWSIVDSSSLGTVDALYDMYWHAM